MTQVPDPIDRYSDVALWGVSPISILAANHCLSTSSKTDWELLRRQYDVWTLQTNYQPPWETYQNFVSRLAEDWLVSPLQQTAAFIEPQQYSQFLTGCLYHNGSDGIIRLLNWASQQYEPESPDKQIVIRRQDVSQYADRSDIRLLASIGAVSYTSDGYVFDRTIIDALTTGLESSREQAAWALLARLLEQTGLSAPEPVIRNLLTALEYPHPDDPPSSTAGSIPVYVLSQTLEPLVTDLFDQELAEVVQDLRMQTDDRIKNLASSLRFDFVATDPEQDVSWPLPDSEAAVCAIASQREVPVAADWVVENTDEPDIFTVHAQLQDAGIDVILRDRLLVFEQSYAPPIAPRSSLGDYQNWLEQEISALREQHRVFSELEEAVQRQKETHRSEIVEQSLTQLEQCDVRPTTFVYTMLDPDRLKQFSEDRYVGESSHLEDELQWIRRWREDAPVDARPFSDVLPELISYPLEHEGVKPELRIMSPWFNFALQDYVALFNRLLENGVKIKMLFRLPSHREWNRMQSDFFERIGDTHDNLQLRTYTRYRKYREQSELVEIEESSDEYLDDFGVHAKLYIAGDHTSGALLTGSANLMENSLHFNPEAGLYTHESNLIQTAGSYFDLIWRLAEADKIPERVMFGEVPFKFYPKVYEP